MEYKVCILAAGMNKDVSAAKDFHVALLPIGEKSAITKIIEKFPKEIEIVIAAGYNAQLIKDFVGMAHDNRKITIVEIPDWSAPGSGPGKSLLACKDYLGCPFIFTAADTVVSDQILEPTENWVGVSQVSDSTPYCMADVENDFVINFFDKVDTPTLLKTCKNYKTILNNAFIGMAGVHDYETFWEGLELNQGLINKEYQVSNGLSELIRKGIRAIPFFNWFDIGKEAGYNFANRYFNKNPVIIKPDEFIYFENKKVIKYFSDKNIVKQRYERSKKLQGIVPEIMEVKENFYSYTYVEGKTLSEINDVSIFKQFLDFCESTIWRRQALSPEKLIEFKNLCEDFHYKKTIERINQFFRKNGIKDQEEIINGEKVPTLKEMISHIDWEKLSEGTPVTFHGDVQPENIIVCNKGFQLIDWRHNFAGITDYGDIYYDFVKLYHALIVTHEVIRGNQFNIKINKNNINYDFILKSNLIEYQKIFEEFLEEKGYDLKKVKLLTALQFLNIATLHHTPYDKFLYYLGKYNLYRELNHNNSYKLKSNENLIQVIETKNG